MLFLFVWNSRPIISNSYLDRVSIKAPSDGDLWYCFVVVSNGVPQ